jgi:hypothetical protein
MGRDFRTIDSADAPEAQGAIPGAYSPYRRIVPWLSREFARSSARLRLARHYDMPSRRPRARPLKYIGVFVAFSCF